MKNLITQKLRVLGMAVVLSGLSVVAVAGREPLRLGPDTTISFAANRANLSKESVEKLTDLIKKAKASGKIDGVQIAVWSDNPAPAEGKELSQVDRKLADDRQERLSSYLKKGLGLDDVSSYNMAERANWLARSLNTNDAKLKAEINDDDDQPMSQDAFKIFRNNGQPSKAVILVIMKK